MNMHDYLMWTAVLLLINTIVAVAVNIRGVRLNPFTIISFFGIVLSLFMKAAGQ